MNPETDMRAALLEALRGDAALAALVNLIHDGNIAKATPPYVALTDCISSEWGTKDREGRELRISFTIEDEAEGASRIGQIMPLIEAAVQRVAHAPPAGWDIGSCALARSRLVGRAQGRWSAVLDFRVRMLGAP